MRKQEDGESVDGFITALYELVYRHCNYGALREEMICDMLVFGIRDSKLSENLQLDCKLTLEKAIVQACQKETVKQQQPLLRGGSVNKTTLQALVGVVNKKPNSTNPGNSSVTLMKQKGVSKGTCTCCGKSPSHDRQHCAPRETTCHK